MLAHHAAPDMLRVALCTLGNVGINRRNGSNRRCHAERNSGDKTDSFHFAYLLLFLNSRKAEAVALLVCSRDAKLMRRRGCGKFFNLFTAKGCYFFLIELYLKCGSAP